MRLLVTAGPTREYLDNVRFISNASTGAMGFAIGAVAAQRGHSVILVTGPTSLQPPKGVEVESVVSAQQMQQAVQRHYAQADAVVMTAAVSDYRPEKRLEGKLKKTGQPFTLKLVPNPDILAGLGREKGGRILVGFALEATADRANAAAKLRAKNLDYIVLDTPAAMGAERASVVILSADGTEEELRDAPKQAVAARIIDLIEQKGRP